MKVGVGERYGVSVTVAVGMGMVPVYVGLAVTVSVGVSGEAGGTRVSSTVRSPCEHAPNPRARQQIALKIPKRFNDRALQYPPSLSEEL